MTKEQSRAYLCIDMKCFFASVECAERGLDPFSTPLVVADESRGKSALCLAISPKLKAMGVRNRCRLNDIPPSIRYTVAKPRMAKYIEYAADIYEIYLDYVSPEDIHVYSIDEAFLDVTEYLTLFGKTAEEMASLLMEQIARRKHIPAAAGVGTNLYLAKIALDITAKHTKDHIGVLDEETYRRTLWDHRPLTDFWQVAKGTAARLARYGIYDMRGVAECPEDVLYRTFGINAELLIDHAWGRESCTIGDIKAYRPRSRSVSNSQILFSDYPFDRARLAMTEMVLAGCEELMRRHLVTDRISLYVGYSRDVAPPAKGTVKLGVTTQLYSQFREPADKLFCRIVDPTLPIRRLGISFGEVQDEAAEGYDLFTDYERLEREKKLTRAVLGVKDRFGKNAVVRGMDLEEGATALVRNRLIGGHNGE